jgi:metallothionein
MTTVTSMKCACDSCLCVVSTSDAVEKDGKYFCSEACAHGHTTGQGCEHHGCNTSCFWSIEFTHRDRHCRDKW